MYLENIFVGSEDIRKQLPAESVMFDDVNVSFKSSMMTLYKAKNVLQGTHTEGLLEKFMDMDSKLEKIQKSLEDYLEKKRQQFPRYNVLLICIYGLAKGTKLFT